MSKNVYKSSSSNPSPKPDMSSSSDAAKARMHMQIIESEVLGSYRPPGTATTRPEVEWVRNALDGSILRDHKGYPVSVERMLATKPLKAELSSRPGPGGKKLTYLSGEGVTRTLNDIFGFDGWNLEIVKTQREECVKDDKGRFHVAYTSQVRLTHKKSGTYKEDVGASDSIDRIMGTAVAHALKGSITDALKRAARHFGEKLGNTLYQGSFNVSNAPVTLRDALDQYDKEQSSTKFGAVSSSIAVADPNTTAITTTSEVDVVNLDPESKQSATKGTSNAALPTNIRNPQAQQPPRPNQQQPVISATTNNSVAVHNPTVHAQTNAHQNPTVTKTPAPSNPHFPNGKAVVSATPVDRTVHPPNEALASLSNRLGAPPKMNWQPPHPQSRQSYPPTTGGNLPSKPPQQNNVSNSTSTGTTNTTNGIHNNNNNNSANPPPPLSATQRLNQGMFAGVHSQNNKENNVQPQPQYNHPYQAHNMSRRPETSNGRNNGAGAGTLPPGGMKRPAPPQRQAMDTNKKPNIYAPFDF